MKNFKLNPGLAVQLLVVCSALVIAVVVHRNVRAIGSDMIGLDGRPLTPAGTILVDKATGKPAVAAMPMAFVRSPDTGGPDGRGRYLISINSGFGVQFDAKTKASQSISVIDLKAEQPQVIQNIYFPSPQSANVGAAFDPHEAADGSFKLYVSGGFENKIWVFKFSEDSAQPISPQPDTSTTPVSAPSIDVSEFATEHASFGYNSGRPPVYPTGLALSADGSTLFVANNLADNLGIVSDIGGTPKLAKVDLHRANKEEFVYPYSVVALNSADGKSTRKVYVSCWNTATVAVIDPSDLSRGATHIAVAGHPTAMVLNAAGTRLFVVNSASDSVSVIDTVKDAEVERIDVRLQEKQGVVGNAPESMALSSDEKTLFIANSRSNTVAVVELSDKARGEMEKGDADGHGDSDDDDARSKVQGFIPTGFYPSAVAVAGGTLFVANGKGTGFDNSSTIVNNTGRSPNAPNEAFPAGRTKVGEYILALVSGNISAVRVPDAGELTAYTRQSMANNGMASQPKSKLFAGPNPIKHVIYIIKENRSYDQVFGDIPRAGDGQPADGVADLAIFGNGSAAQRPGGAEQKITPNFHALALRFGLLDRFFVNSEASPDGHNWSTAAFSSDYVDKAYRWNYSKRGRTYDFEGFDRLPDFSPPMPAPRSLTLPATADKVAGFMERFIPYLNGSRDVAEPESLYLWDAAQRAGLTYRTYGEFVATVSAADLEALNSRKEKKYPDLTPNVSEVPTKKALEGHFSAEFRNFDLFSPDIFTTDSYKSAVESKTDPVIGDSNPDTKFHGVSRFSVWKKEFQSYVDGLKQGVDRMPNLTILRFPNDHTSGLDEGLPTPQFHVADNDYACGRLVQEISNSPYWKDTAIFILEDDAQNGPDHVDAHRSPALVISAYNRPGALVHNYYTTVSLIRTMEILLGMAPMNQLDAQANPIDVFQDKPDITPYTAAFPQVSMDNLLVQKATDSKTAYWMEQTEKQDFSHEDMADPDVLNRIIWYSVRGQSDMPVAAHLPVVDALRNGIKDGDDVKKMRIASAKGKAKQRDPDGD